MKNHCIVLGISAMFMLSCNPDRRLQEELQVLPVTEVISRDTIIYTDYVAEIHALQNVEIRARVSGYLEQFHVDEGSGVKSGQLLFTINQKEYAEEVAKAKGSVQSAMAEVKAAELELKNSSALAEKKIISATEVELAKSKVESLKAKLEEARAHMAYAEVRLSNTQIRAPFNGIINRLHHKIGSLIEEGTLLTSISQNDEVFAYFDVSEKEYLKYARNTGKETPEFNTVSLILADGIEHTHKGRIETIEGEIDERTGSIAFRARFPNPHKIIKHGASGKVRVQKKIEDALIIPQKSTFEIQDKLYVYVVDKDNKLQMRNIQSGLRLPHLFLVSSGLRAGERIIYEGIQNAHAGDKISPKIKSMFSLINEFKNQ